MSTEHLVRLEPEDSEVAERYIAKGFGADEELVAKICAEYRYVMGPFWVRRSHGE